MSERSVNDPLQHGWVETDDGKWVWDASSGGSGGGLWEQNGDDIYYDAGNVGIGMVPETDTFKLSAKEQLKEWKTKAKTSSWSEVTDGEFSQQPTEDLVAQWIETRSLYPSSHLQLKGYLGFGLNGSAQLKVEDPGNSDAGTGNVTLGLIALSDSKKHWFTFGESPADQTGASKASVFRSTSNIFRLSVGPYDDLNGLVMDDNGDTTFSGTVVASNVTTQGTLEAQRTRTDNYQYKNGNSIMQTLTQAQYDGLTPNADTVYFIV